MFEYVMTKNMNNWNERRNGLNPKGRVLGGLVVVLVGATLLAYKAGVKFPEWLITWEMLLIAIGVYVGVKNQFRGLSWVILISVGGLFLTDHYLVEDLNIGQYIWPIVIIVVGLAMILRPRSNFRNKEVALTDTIGSTDASTFAEDKMEAVAVMGGVKKNVISKNFKGGEAVAIMGGLEINLTQADIHDNAKLELVTIMGGTVLTVPSNWRVSTDEVACILGGLEDKRILLPETEQPIKTLRLTGVCIFGGIEIKNY